MVDNQLNQTKINGLEFKDLLNGTKESFSEHTKANVLTHIEFDELEHSPSELKDLVHLGNDLSDIHKSSVLRRIVAVKMIKEAANLDSPLDFKAVWSLIYDSLINLDEQAIISSIGSQGFLSIPLFRLDKGSESFEFLRLHIWDKSLHDYIDFEKVERFAIFASISCE